MRDGSLLITGGEAGHPAIATFTDFQAWARGGCFVDPQNDLPRFRFLTPGQFMEWAYARRWPLEHVERILSAVGKVLGMTSAGAHQQQGALNAQVFTAATTSFTVPDNVNNMAASGFGGGGGGGSGASNATTASGGGGGGGSMQGLELFATTPAAVVTVGCGAGGGGAAAATGAAGNLGQTGDDSTFPGASITATFLGASGGGDGSTTASSATAGGLNVRRGAALGTQNYYASFLLTPVSNAASPSKGTLASTAFPLNMTASGGMSLTGGLAGNAGNRNIGGSTSGAQSSGGGTAGVASGGGGGGSGPGASGGNGGAGVASGTANAGATPAANTGAGGGGGGAQATAASASGAGGSGGSGSVTAVW